MLVCAQSNAAVDELVTRLDAQVCHAGHLQGHSIEYRKATQACITMQLLLPSCHGMKLLQFTAVALLQGLFTGDGRRRKARLVRMGKLESFSTAANRRFHIDAQAAEYATRGDSSIQGACLSCLQEGVACMCVLGAVAGCTARL